jgi:signal transduction histidine kinase/CheY-like chemotaxis protein
MHAAIWPGTGGFLTKKATTAVVLFLTYLVALWASSSLTTPDHMPLFWLCDAFIAAMVVALGDSPVLRPTLILTCLCTIPIMREFTPNYAYALSRTALNMGEGILCGWLSLKVLGPRRLLRTTVGFLKLQLLAILPAALVNMVMREATLRLLGDPSLASSWRMAFLPHHLGLAITLPALLLVFQPPAVGLRRSWLETVLIIAGLALVTHLVFNVLRFPTAFALSPLMLIAGIRLGPRGSVFGHLAVALVCLPGTISGAGSFTLHPEWNAQARAVVYQAVILSSSFGITLCAFAVAEQARLRRLLTIRAAAAREARRRALSASRAKTEFLATMSHEIRTPMNSILGFTQLLMNNPGVSPAAREQVKVISEAGDSLMTVLNDILDFSKVEGGHIELHLEAIELEGLLGAAAEIMRGPARAKDLMLRLETEGLEGAAFRLDGQRLRQVLLNLLNNAVKFTREGHILLSAALSPDGRTLRLQVEDTGIGIDEEVIGRLFTRFSQADSSTTRHYGGSGLGLAICKGLVEHMGGRIGVESRVGYGSNFWFEIPAERVASEGERLAEEQPSGALKGRVLLVDDHPMNLRLGETLLQMLGCEVDLVASGEEAVEAARAKVYDAILMDVHMPGIDGLAATRAILQLEGPSGQTPIIAMTADVMPQNIERCRAAGMVDQLAKPVQIKTLHEVLARCMAQNKQKHRSAA